MVTVNEDQYRTLSEIAHVTGNSVETVVKLMVTDHLNNASGKRQNNVFCLEDYRQPEPEPAA